jgi:hypothetical protein
MICPLMRKRRTFLRIESYIKRRKWDDTWGTGGTNARHGRSVVLLVALQC